MKATDLVTIRSQDRDLLKQISKQIEETQDVVEIPMLGVIPAGPPTPTPDEISTILLALGSAGAFTTLYQVLAKLLERNKDREITLERGDAKITVRGHSLPEERTLIQELFPESRVIEISRKN